VLLEKLLEVDRQLKTSTPQWNRNQNGLVKLFRVARATGSFFSKSEEAGFGLQWKLATQVSNPKQQLKKS
jgi:hypothetical protein